MRVTSISASSAPSVFSHSNRVTGVLAGHHELDALTRALECVGVSNVEILEDDAGAGYLDQREHSFRGFLEFLFSELKPDMRHRYGHEIGQGRLVFAVPVTQGTKDDVVKAVLAHGASHVAHFGKWIDESFGQP
jgi:hypothetical protein